tara:strand:- start:1622 stop:1939 length:318 start_codon:yes stop_codon:yes gene_type:complete
MKKVVNLAYILTILIFIDLVSTLYWVNAGLATEANPIMNFFFEQSSLLFTCVKLGLSFGGILILYLARKRFRKAILNILLGLNFVYIAICGWHLWGMLFLVSQTN